ncbi:MAG: hypothetical protein ACTSXQ_01360 [Alphaproteobacteria bacterium]
MRIGASKYYQMKNSFASQKERLADLQRQLEPDAGKYKDLADIIGNRTPKFLDFKFELQRREKYVENIENVEINIKTVKHIFETFEESLDDMISMSASVQGIGHSNVDAMTQMAENTFELLEDLLNTTGIDGHRVLGGYMKQSEIKFDVFDTNAAYDYKQGAPTAPFPPVLLAGSLASTAAPYLTDGVDDTATLSIKASDYETIDYSFQPYESWIQKMVYGLDVLRKAKDSDPSNVTPPNVGVDFEDSVGYAMELLKEAKYGVKTPTGFDTGLRHAVNQADLHLLRLNDVKERHEVETIFFDDLLYNMDYADQAEVATELTFLQVQLEASFQTTKVISDLNLMDRMPW